jgi:REP element-mobilizing transposase RayT
MSTGYQIYDKHGAYFLTFQIVDWVDIFSRKVYRDIIVGALNYCTEYKHLQVSAWVIMTNHIHIILRSDKNNLSDIVRDFKAHTARQILKHVTADANESRKQWMQHVFSFNASQHKRNEKLQLWTHENHAIYLDPLNPELYQTRINYIHQNPVRAGWVLEAEHYLYSSAIDFAGGKGMVKLEV